MQISTFFRTNLLYCDSDAYGIVLNRVPNLDASAKDSIKRFVRVKKKPSRGVVTNPRPLDKLAEQTKVSIHVAMYASQLLMS